MMRADDAAEDHWMLISLDSNGDSKGGIDASHQMRGQGPDVPLQALL